MRTCSLCGHYAVECRCPKPTASASEAFRKMVQDVVQAEIKPLSNRLELLHGHASAAHQGVIRINEEIDAKKKGRGANSMATNPTATTDKPGVITRTKSSLKEGAKLAAANEAGEIALEVMVALVPQLGLLAETPTGKAVGKMVSAVLLSYAAEASGFESSEMVQLVCDKVVTVSSMELTADKLKLLRPAFVKLAELSKTLGEAPVPASEKTNG